jgi:tripartite-type tricarboxylate transporter receptor subunit TctC
MLGATGLAMANYLYNVAPKDGSYIGLIQNGLPAFQTLGMPEARFETGKFNWIGSMAPSIETMAVWKTSGVKTIDDAKTKEVVTGSVGRTGISLTFPRMLNELLGTKFRIVGGYPGAGAVNIALERGEVSARSNAWSAWKTNNSDWLRNGDLIILLYSGKKPADLNGVPALEELVKAEADLQLINLVTAGSQFGHPFAMSPGVPRERVEALRHAFAAMLKDPEFIKDAEAARSEIDPVSGEHLQQVAQSLSTIPEQVKTRAKRLYE